MLGRKRVRSLPNPSAGSFSDGCAGKPAELKQVAEPRFSIVTPVYETPAGVLGRCSTRSGARASATGSCAWSTTLASSRTSRAMLERAAAARPADPGRQASRERRHRRRLERRAGDGPGRVRRPARPRRQAPPRRAAPASTRRSRAEPEADYLYTDEDKIDRDGRHCGAVLQARLVAGADADPDVHLPPQRPAPLAGRGGGRVRPRVRGLPGLGPGAEGDRAGPARRPRPPGPLPLAAARDLGRGRGRRARSRGRSRPGQRAVQAHCERIGLQARVERDDGAPGVYHLHPRSAGTAGQHRDPDRRPGARGPLRGGRARRALRPQHRRDLDLRRTTRSSAWSTPRPSRRCSTSCEAIGGDRLRVVPYDRPFSFSAKINLGAVHSEGELLLLLNDDMEVVTPDWIERMAMYSSIPGIGAVGGRLLWEDGRLQHAGVLLRERRSPGPPLPRLRRRLQGLRNNVLIAQNYLAVTGACLMTRARAVRGGRRPVDDLPVNYNDIDYCLKLRTQGMRVVYDPDTVLYHFESSSRSSDVEDWEVDHLARPVAAPGRRRPLHEPEPPPRDAEAAGALHVGAASAAAAPAARRPGPLITWGGPGRRSRSHRRGRPW